MKKLLSLFACCVALCGTASAQTLQQYFDGADTSANNSLLIEIDNITGSNVWQIGPPQKTLFNAAATVPNVIVTDTIAPYPPSDSSSFQYTVPADFLNNWGWGVLAIQWTQKLDLDSLRDGGLIEYSTDGVSWSNVFNDPYVYNFYGYQPVNYDTLISGEMGFTGTDTTWRDIWLCYDYSWLSFADSLMIRYSLLSDTIDNGSEGWMMDNFVVHATAIHTVAEKPQEEYMKVFPTATTGRVNIQLQKRQEFHIIENMVLFDATGKVVQSWGKAPTKYFIDIAQHSPGIYYLTVATNIETNTVPLFLQRNNSR